MVISCSTCQKEEKECFQVNAVCCDFKFVVIYALFLPNVPSQNFRVPEKMFFSKSGWLVDSTGSHGDTRDHTGHLTDTKPQQEDLNLRIAYWVFDPKFWRLFWKTCTQRCEKRILLHQHGLCQNYSTRKVHKL